MCEVAVEAVSCVLVVGFGCALDVWHVDQGSFLERYGRGNCAVYGANYDSGGALDLT